VDPFEVGIDGGTGRKISTSPDVRVGGITKPKMDGTVHTSCSKRGPFMYIQYIYIHDASNGLNGLEKWCLLVPP